MTVAPPAQPSAPSFGAWRLGALVVAWGMEAIVTQSLLLRESMVLMFGTELAWGIVLFAWLLGIAGGAALGGRLARGPRRTDRAAGALVVVLVLLSAGACLDLWIFRGVRQWFAVGPGELLPLGRTAVAALLLVTPLSALVGVSFPLACCVPRLTNPPQLLPQLSFGQIYALESAGSLIGGAAFSFWAVEHLVPPQTALLSGAITVAACAMLAQRRTSRVVLALLATASLLAAVCGVDWLNRVLVQRRWDCLAPGYELIAEAESKYQNLAVGHRADQYSLYCDGHVAVDFPDPYTFVPRAHFWLCQHPDPRRVLLLGGGPEGLLAEILRHPVASVDYVEPDERVLSLLTPLLAEADSAALRDPRVRVHHRDARHYVKTQRGRFDLVIARLPEPTSAQRARLFTAEFYRELHRALQPEGVVCLTASAAPAELPPLARDYLAAVRATLQSVFPHVTVGWDDPAQLLAATAPGLTTTDPRELQARYAARRVQAPLFDPAWFDGATDWLTSEKLAQRAAELDAVARPAVSTDLQPTVYLQRLALWEAATGRSHLISRLRSISTGPLLAVVVFATVLAYAGLRLGRRGPAGAAAAAISLSIGTTGFVTMALSIVWLFAFQSLYGYVYQRIGWIIALFMAGLVMGCLAAGRMAARHARVRAAPLGLCLLLVDLLLAGLAALAPVVLRTLAGLSTGGEAFAAVEATISGLVAVTGLLGGAAFAFAGPFELRLTAHAGRAAGTVVSADHVGACLGALVCGVVLVPILGIPATAGLLAGLKLLSSGALLLARRSLA